jgi:hypothetical protein
MHSSVIGKIEKANRYARELDRVKFERMSLTFRGDNDSHRVRLDADGWACTCHAFGTSQDCAHVLALQKMFAKMLSDSAQATFTPDVSIPLQPAVTA